MAIEIVLIGTVVVMALFAVVYYLGYREDRQQREALQAEVQALCASEEQDRYGDESNGEGFTSRQHRDPARIGHRPESAKARTSEEAPLRAERNRSA